MSAPALPRPRLMLGAGDATAAPVSVVRALPAYVLTAAVGEALVAFGEALEGAIVEAALILVILNHYAFVARGTDGGAYAQRGKWRLAVLPVLALLPLLRLVSLAMPLTELPQAYWPLAVGAPVLTAAILVVRALGLSAGEIGLRMSSWLWQAGIVLAAAPLGLAAYHILDPAPLNGPPVDIALQVGILVVFAAFTEELVFRGLAQRAFDGVLGLPGFIWSTCLFAVAYIGAQPAAFVAFMVAVGLLFGLVVGRTGSIVGVMIAHALLLVTLLVVWPQVLPRDATAAATAPPPALLADPLASVLAPASPQPSVRLVSSPTRSASSISRSAREIDFAWSLPPGRPVRAGLD